MISLETIPSKADRSFDSRAGRKKHRPRLGFLGVGWIGRNRMEAIAQSGLAEISAIADASVEMTNQAAAVAPRAVLLGSLEELLNQDLDGIVIATPSALHAEQSIAALEAGVAVFCQKPVARTARETRQVVESARYANKLLGVDLSYRFVNGVPQLRDLIKNGALGKIYSVDTVFHNAYGPDKPWFYDARLSGGGCVIDLGIHLVDLVLWTLGFPKVEAVSSRLFAQGERAADVSPAESSSLISSPQICQRDAGSTLVEDFAVAQMDLEDGTTVQLACSWRAHAGCDAVIRASFYGTKGGIEFRNVNGSFYDFAVERFSGTKRETIAAPPDVWGGRAAVDWAERLAAGSGYDPSIEGLIEVAETLDGIYGR
ncbi:MAG: Gfo/Idh/MocA family oxidoreductase [Verrucomicrobia bacterium]|nr:Gfo/Idh/MocA family oxidoreductase [Verrucomicrobiota bacterium]